MPHVLVAAAGLVLLALAPATAVPAPVLAGVGSGLFASAVMPAGRMGEPLWA
jgi:hypothetical protein